jgi:hypothetical protein
VSTLELEHIKHADLASGNNISLTSAGNVGVGAAPVAGDFEVHCASGGELRVDNYGASGVLIKQLNGGSGTSGSMMMQGGTSIILATNDTNEAMRINSSGNVGIGTSNPDAPLHVEATNASMLLSNSGRTQYWRIQNNESSDALVFNANDSAERMRIDNAGYVTKAFQPAFGVGRGGGNVAINTDYVWDTVRFNIGSHYNTSNGRFTAPVDGRYHFDINLMSNDIIYNNKFWQLRLNGSEYQRIYSTNGGAYHHRWNWNGTLELSANDYIVVHSYSVGLYGGNALYSHFSGYLLG